MSTVLVACDRLAASRERMRQAMQAAGAAEAARRHAAAPAWEWLQSLESIPGVGVVIKAARTWWAQHPLRIASVAAGQAAQAVLQPLAQRHPLGLVMGAALLGGLVVLTRPWRWMFRPALFAGLLPQLFRSVSAQVSTQTWAAVLAGLLLEPHRPTPEPAEPTQTPQPIQPTQPNPPPQPVQAAPAKDGVPMNEPMTFH
jgi:hypothetical protein